MLVEMFKRFCVFLKMFILFVNLEHLLVLLLLEKLPHPRRWDDFLSRVLAKAKGDKRVLLRVHAFETVAVQVKSQCEHPFSATEENAYFEYESNVRIIIKKTNSDLDPCVLDYGARVFHGRCDTATDCTL